MVKEKSLVPDMSTGPSGERPLRIRRGRVDSVDLYEIKDSELDVLEKGSPSSIQLNFAIFLLSLAFSAIMCLSTATFKYNILSTVLVVVAVVGTLLGGYLLLSWIRTRRSMSTVVRNIRARIPQEPISAQPPEADSAPSLSPKEPE